jgi:serine/threonine protein kinase
MTNPIDPREEEIFAAVSEMEDPQARADYLDRTCSNDHALRKRVESLLLAQERADVHLGERGQLPEADLLQAEADQGLAEGPGTVISRYRLLEKIGEGGFGVVYMAEQEEPIRRKVALKIIKLGMDTRQVVARFEAERQALAMMDHPNVATVLDAGTTESGRPYFVMELIKGIPITEFCDRNRLTTEERLQLFLSVCQAVQHAHQKGIIHRDLKPTNVLVTLDYGQPTPKVIDFGIAKAINQRLTEKTLYTRFAQMVGTPAYMSPEQAEMSSLDIDTRTDVYSLGVLLYELLTGTTPLTEQRLRGLGYAGIQRAIAQEEPEKPSTRLSTLGRELAVIAQRRNTDTSVLSRLIRGDLDWIVLKSIEKDRRRRYDSPGDLAADIRRHLADEAVIATPPSTIYKLRKFARRNKALVTAGLAIGAMLLLTAGFSTWQAIRATRSEAAARKEAETSQAMLEFLRDDLLSVADPFAGAAERPRGRNLTLLTAVDLAARNVGERFQSQPQVEAGIRVTLWQIYFALGEMDKAETNVNRALELSETKLSSEPLLKLKARESKAWMLRERVKYPEATELIESVIAERTRLQGDVHPEVLKARHCRMAILSSSGRIPEAIQLGTELLEPAKQLPAEHTDILLRVMSDLSWAFYQQGNFPRCHEFSEEALAIARNRLGDDHAHTIELMRSWAVWLRVHLDKLHEAERLQHEAYERARRLFGDKHGITFDSASELALLAGAKGLFGKQLEMQENLVALSRQALGSDSPGALFEQMRLAWVRLDESRHQDAETLLSDALKRLRETQGPDDFLVRRAMRWLAGVHTAQGKYHEAIALRRDVVDKERRLLGYDAHWTHVTSYQLANLHARLGQWAEAPKLFRTFLPQYDPVKTQREHQSLYPASFITGALASDTEVARDLAAVALKSSEATDDWRTRYEIAFALLLAPELVSERPRLFALASQVLQDAPESRHKDLLAGLLAFRGNEFENSVRLLTPLAGEFASPSSGLASAFLAMANQHLGLAAEAANHLSRARNCLERLTRPGDLGYMTFYPREEWLPVAELILVCREAELLIHGRETSPTIDESYLAAARQQWQPVKALLDETERLAQQRDWVTAHARLRAAMQHEFFDWGAALLTDRHLHLKAAALFVLAGDVASYDDFRRRLLESGHGEWHANPRTALLTPADSTSGLAKSVLASVRLAAEFDKDSGSNPWRSLNLGVAEHRSGHAEMALATLKKAEDAYNLSCSGTAHALAALANGDLSRKDKAREHLATAEAAHQKLLDGNRSGLGPDWYDVAILEVFLHEARDKVKDK